MWIQLSWSMMTPDRSNQQNPRVSVASVSVTSCTKAFPLGVVVSAMKASTAMSLLKVLDPERLRISLLTPCPATPRANRSRRGSAKAQIQPLERWEKQLQPKIPRTQAPQPPQRPKERFITRATGPGMWIGSTSLASHFTQNIWFIKLFNYSPKQKNSKPESWLCFTNVGLKINIPLNPMKSHEIPLNPVKSHEIPLIS